MKRGLITAAAAVLLLSACDEAPTLVDGSVGVSDAARRDGSPGLIDAARPDQASGLDANTGPADGRVTLDRRVTADKNVTPRVDSGLVLPDLGSATSSYGISCRVGSKCPRPLSCINSQIIAKNGVCTKPCRVGNDCRGGPAGTFAACIFQRIGETQKWCVFVCDTGSAKYACPAALKCDRTAPWLGTKNVYGCVPK